MESCKLELSPEAAVVFREWLARFNETGEAAFADQAEQCVPWDVESVLESQLAEPLKPDYANVLASARQAVRDSTK